jgi:hypothetical protein
VTTTVRAPRPLALIAFVVGLVSVILAGGASAVSAHAAAAKTFVVYSVPTSQQFVNNADDRARGQGINPFGNYRGTGIATQDEHVGPLPGDEGLYAYNLFPTSAVKAKTQAGGAIFVCNYNFAKDGFCSVAFQLNGGSLIAVGDYSALVKHRFALAVTGGTGIYRGVTGSIEATSDNVVPSVSEIQVLSHEVPSLQLESQRLSFTILPSGSGAIPTSPTAAMPGSEQLTVYSLATQEQFVDNGDDEARGWTANPFGLRDRAQEFAENEDKGGPYPGDAALFAFKLFSDEKLTMAVGTASFSCFYYFAKDAFCDSNYQLPGGSLVGSNAFAFNATTFSLAITGGTGKYAIATGDVGAQESSDQAERLTFTIHPR